MAWQVSGETVIQQSNVQGPSSDQVRIAALRMYRGGEDFADGRLSAELGSIDDGDLGLLFRVQDPKSYYAFCINTQEGKQRLIRVERGTATLLAEIDQNFEPGVWHQVDIELRGAEMAISLDGKEHLTARDGAFAQGTVGIHTWANRGARFRSLNWSDEN
jgi:hypothetical protein